MILCKTEDSLCNNVVVQSKIVLSVYISLYKYGTLYTTAL